MGNVVSPDGFWCIIIHYNISTFPQLRLALTAQKSPLVGWIALTGSNFKLMSAFESNALSPFDFWCIIIQYNISTFPRLRLALTVQKSPLLGWITILFRFLIVIYSIQSK